MDAAAAAAMSDPERNPLFRRRWIELAAVASEVPVVHPGEDGIELTGIALLVEWRSSRATACEQVRISDLSKRGASPLLARP